VRDGVAKQITKDQSLMQKLIEAGELTEEEAAQSERRNIILQALGPEASIKVDLTHQQLRKGDTLVLCSDGLSGQVTKEDIANAVTENPDLVAACKKLIDMANDAGGPDNITVILARFDGEGLTSSSDGDDVGHRVFSLPEMGQTPMVSMEKISDAATQPIEQASRPTKEAAMRGDLDAITVPVENYVRKSTPPAPTPSAEAITLESIETASIPQKRRSTGMIVAIALLIALIAFGAWYAIQTVQKVAPPDSTQVSA
jgi:hypothetical protein